MVKILNPKFADNPIFFKRSVISDKEHRISLGFSVNFPFTSNIWLRVKPGYNNKGTCSLCLLCEFAFVWGESNSMNTAVTVCKGDIRVNRCAV